MNKTAERERDEARARAEAAEGLLANLIQAVQSSVLTEDDAVYDAVEAASGIPGIEAWKELLARISERESNIDGICKRSERTRDLLESTQIEFDLVVVRLAGWLRARATSEQITADRYRDLATRNELPHPNEEYRLRDRHEHAATVLTEQAKLLEDISVDTLARAKADTAIERARLRIEHLKEAAAHARRLHMGVLAIDKRECLDRTDTLLSMLDRFIEEEATK